jgi:hypothetical protein
MSNGNRNISGKLRGLPRDRLNSLKIDYPSISPIREFCSSTDIRGFKVRIPRRSGGNYNVVILCDNLLNEAPSAYVLDDIDGHYHLWKKMTIPGTRKRRPLGLRCVLLRQFEATVQQTRHRPSDSAGVLPRARNPSSQLQ